MSSAFDFPSSQLKPNWRHNLQIRRSKARTWHNNRLYVWPLLTTRCSSVLLYRVRHRNDSDGTESGGSRYQIGHSLNSRRFLARGCSLRRGLQTLTRKRQQEKERLKMRIHKQTTIIVSLVVLAVITAILVRYRSVAAQQDRAARAPISTKAALQQTEGDGFNTSPTTETKIDTDTDLYLDADEVER